jgi:Transposase
LADLLRHGLLRASFIPPAPVRTIRELTRYRKTLVQQRVDEANRLQKTLEGANIKLAAVASDVLGVSGRAMLAAVLDGERDPGVLAELARGVLRAKLPQLRQALNGRVQPHHLVLISQLLAHIDFLEQAIAQVQAGRDRRRHESVPDGRASGLMGWPMPQQQGERWQADEGAGESWSPRMMSSPSQGRSSSGLCSRNSATPTTVWSALRRMDSIVRPLVWATCQSR